MGLAVGMEFSGKERKDRTGRRDDNILYQTHSINKISMGINKRKGNKRNMPDKCYRAQGIAPRRKDERK